jgi:aminoglycoside phosphotransferase (APT) family kinase protein
MTGDDLDPAAILGALGWGDAAVVERVTGGWDTALWRVERDGAGYALRVFRPEQADTCRREAAVIEAASAAGLPVPSVHAVGTWRDRPAQLLAWCPGRTVLAEFAAHPWRTWSLGVLLGRTQAAIHATPAPAILRDGVRAWPAWAGPDEGPLQERLRALNLRADALLHLDYHPLNVLVDRGGVSGVIDWANAAAGDPRADLARSITILRLAPEPAGAATLLRRSGRRILEAGLRHGYQRVAGPPGDLGLFYAWAGAAMERDLAAKIGRPGILLTERDLEPIRRWTARWKTRVGLAA